MIPDTGRLRSHRKPFSGFGETMTRPTATSTTSATAQQIADLISAAESARRQGNYARYVALMSEAARLGVASASSGSTGGGSSQTSSGTAMLMTRDGAVEVDNAIVFGPTSTSSTSDPSKKPVMWAPPTTGQGRGGLGWGFWLAGGALVLALLGGGAVAIRRRRVA